MTRQCDKSHLPSTKHRLGVGRRYRFYFKLFLPCDSSFAAIVWLFYFNACIPCIKINQNHMGLVHIQSFAGFPRASHNNSVTFTEDLCRGWKWVESRRFHFFQYVSLHNFSLLWKNKTCDLFCALKQFNQNIKCLVITSLVYWRVCSHTRNLTPVIRCSQCNGQK